MAIETVFLQIFTVVNSQHIRSVIAFSNSADPAFPRPNILTCPLAQGRLRIIEWKAIRWGEIVNTK